jgi:hypothetical protein
MAAWLASLNDVSPDQQYTPREAPTRRMQEDEDAASVDQAARQYIQRFGRHAARYLRAQADIARIEGDQLSADAWDEIASAAERLL